jgi:hypothetical protein
MPIPFLPEAPILDRLTARKILRGPADRDREGLRFGWWTSPPVFKFPSGRLPRSSPAFRQVGDVPHPAFNSFRCRASAGGHWARVARLDDSTSFKVEKLMNSSSLKVTWIRDSINEFCSLSEAAFASGLVATGALASFSSLVSESAKAASSAYVRIRRILRASSRRTRRVPSRIQSQRRTRAPTEHRCRNETRCCTSNRHR